MQTKREALIAAEPLLTGQPIDVEVREGILLLKGKVAREE